MRKNIIWKLVAFAGAVALSGCLGGAPTGGTGTGTGHRHGRRHRHRLRHWAPAPAPAPAAAPATPAARSEPGRARTIDYGQALRTAALKLVGTLPTLDEQAGVTDATTYAAQIDKYLADPRFALQIKSYYSDMMKMGGTLKAVVGNNTVNVSLDTAPTFAAELVVQDQPITNLFTATTNTCPTLSADGATFTDAACAGGQRPQDVRRAHRPGRDGAVLLEHGVPPRALDPGVVRLHQVPRRVLGDAGGEGQRPVHLAVADSLDHRRHRARRSTSRTPRRSSAPTATRR